MKNRREAVVAFLIDDERDQYKQAVESIVDGVIHWARQFGWRMIDLRSWLYQIPCATKVDGLIYDHGRGSASSRVADVVENVQFSVQILPERNLAATRGTTTDWQSVGRQAADYFLTRGFRNFALAAYRTEEWNESLKAFRERIDQAGGQCKAIRGMHLTKDTMAGVRKSVRGQLRNLTYPLGIFCANDRLAVRLCHWCNEEGIAVPEQAAILGYGDDAAACRSNPVPLSSISPNLWQHGLEAARLLQRMMDGESVEAGTLIRIPPQGIVTRRSTDITAIADARAARGLRYIWDHYTENIGPDQVAARCGISRRTLDRHFMDALGRTVASEITRYRFKQARDLLVAKDLTVADISQRVGFRTPQYFGYVFRRHFGMTPQSYREAERQKRRRKAD